MQKRKLKLGEDYAVRIVLPGFGKFPRCVTHRKMQLIETRANGVCVMAEDRMVWSWDTEAGDELDAIAGRIPKKPVKRTATRFVKTSDLIGTWAQWTDCEKAKTRDGGVKLVDAA